MKQDALRGRLADFDTRKIQGALYRPFAKKYLFLDRVPNEEVYQWPGISGRVIGVKTGAEWPFFALASGTICDRLPQGGSQCFPLSHLKDTTVAQFQQHYSKQSITKEEIFHYVYALLHHPEYRARYAGNLKRELPRIPFAPDFAAFAIAGKELARLHVEYESLDPWPLQFVEDRRVPYSERVTKMKLSADRQSLRVNESVTLAGIPAEVFEYRLGVAVGARMGDRPVPGKARVRPEPRGRSRIHRATRGPSSACERGDHADRKVASELSVEKTPRRLLEC